MSKKALADVRPAKDLFPLDPKIIAFESEVYNTPLIQDVWREKYLQKDELLPKHAYMRVATAIGRSPVETDPERAIEVFYEMMSRRLFMPGGRILAGAGTSKDVTLMNCYVNGTLGDSIKGIVKGKSDLWETSSMGGGMGTDFSPLRPYNALIRGAGTGSSGAVSFMDTFNADGKVIRSAGERRAAQMGTLSDTHPDLPEFIRAKGEGLRNGTDRLKEFNVSVLISDAFKGAVDDDEDWLLYFHIPPVKRDPDLEQYDFEDDDGVQQYVYAKWRARDLWNLITEYTYEFSDPGVIFIDRVNEYNNLGYCETIRCTNPCVTGDTMILTKQGHRTIKSLVGQEVEVWNGFEWSKVTPFSTGVNPLMEVTFSNGQTVRCTPKHKWHLSNGICETWQLDIGNKLRYVEMPKDVEESTEFTIDAYSQGMYCGDGTKNSEYSNLYKHNEGILNRLVGKIYNRNCESQPGHRWIHGTMLPKDFVPVTGSIEYCINWFAGYLDADGSVIKKQDSFVIEASAKDRNFLRRMGLMLNRLGINYRMWERKDAGLKFGSNGKQYECESTAAIMISHREANKLVRLGMKCERLDLTKFRLPPNGIAKVGHRVTYVRTLEVEEETFCMNEPRRNSFVANGIITHNCGEQPLPPDGTCNLGAINVANVVINPFTAEADINFYLLAECAKWGVRFLDNVINVTSYPLESQRAEEFAKRRIGLGITGLAALFAELGVAYGSHRSVQIASQVMKCICLAAYDESIRLADERGAFPLFQDIIVDYGFIKYQLDDDRKEEITKKGLRNGVILTIAPTGTGSIALGNIPSGLEPDFAFEIDRNVRQNNSEEFKKYTEVCYTKRFYEFCTGRKDIPDYMVVASQLTILDHIKVQAALQKWVDASTSKTINVPTDMPYEQFVEVYELAWQYNLKGTTTYRHSKWRDSILRDASDKQVASEANSNGVIQAGYNGAKRPEDLSGSTYKLKWASMTASMYVTINYLNGRPYEIFFASKDAKFQDWMTGLTLMISSIFRMAPDPSFIVRELNQVVSTHDTQWDNGKFYGSLVSKIGSIIEKDFIKHGVIPSTANTPSTQPTMKPEVPTGRLGELCPSCRVPAFTMQEGCKKCLACGFSAC